MSLVLHSTLHTNLIHLVNVVLGANWGLGGTGGPALVKVDLFVKWVKSGHGRPIDKAGKGGPLYVNKWDG